MEEQDYTPEQYRSIGEDVFSNNYEAMAVSHFSRIRSTKANVAYRILMALHYVSKGFWAHCKGNHNNYVKEKLIKAKNQIDLAMEMMEE